MVALGTILIPAMKKEGYDEDFATALVASSAVIGPIIPPSIPMLVYASVMNVSVAGLFLAGVVPGVIMGLCLMVIVWIISSKRSYGVKTPFPGFKKVLQSTINAIPALLMPIIILGGMLGGYFTATQASAIAAFYGLIIGFVFFRTLKFRDLGPILHFTVRTTAMILFILACAKTFSWLITYMKLIEHTTAILLSISSDKVILLLVMNIILLIAGMFLDMGFSIIVLTPLLAPAAYNLGIHPLHFGLIVCVNLSIGLLSPPFGLILFAACSITNISLARLSKALGWFLTAEVVALMIITYVPEFSLYIPSLFGYVK
jgi:tripartite ATP-independent transporter DctM subunit